MEIAVEETLPIRLDRYLKRIFPSLTQGVIEKYLRAGRIKVNSKKAKSNLRIDNNDKLQVFVDLPKNTVNQEKKIYSQNTMALAQKILDEYLVHKTVEFIAVNKPEGLAVQGGSKIKLSVDDALQYLNETNNTNYKLVHRLDKNTSGVLLIATSATNARILTEAFKELKIKKVYLAIVSGKPKLPKGKIANYLDKIRIDDKELVSVVEEGGKYAETYYEVLESKRDKSLIQFMPTTGRMHQLRVHASSGLECPIIGDVKYSGKKFSRMLLHAHKITLSKEIFGKEYKIECQASPTFFFTIDKLK